MTAASISTADFFAALYPDAESTGELVLWRKRDKMASWGSVATATARAATFADVDLYFGVALRHRPAGLVGEGPYRERGGLEHAATVPGLWLDLDFVKPDKPAAYPPDRAAAEELLSECGLAPSILVASGGGLHGYWLFAEPFEIERESDRQKIEEVSKRWQAWWGAEALAKGWAVDRTPDLARVLRVPGTFNGNGHRPVAVDLWKPDRRYNLDAFEPYQAEGETTEGSGGYRLEADLRARPGLPAMKLSATLDLEPKFRAAWEMRRPDLNGDPSRYDLALASVAANCGWSDSEIVALLVAFRERYNLPAKVDGKKRLREDYYTRTIGKARAQSPRVGRGAEPLEVREVSAEERIAAEARRLKAAGVDVDSTAGRCADVAGDFTASELRRIVRNVFEVDSPSEHLEALSKMIGRPLRAVVKRGRVQGVFELEFQDGSTCVLGSIAVVDNARLSRQALADQCGIYRKLSPKEWEVCARSIVELAVIDETSDPQEELADWLQAFAGRSFDLSHLRAAELAEFFERKASSADRWIRGGALYFRVESFLGFLGTCRKAITRPELEARLRRYGAERVNDSARDAAGRTVKSPRVWRIRDFRRPSEPSELSEASEVFPIREISSGHRRRLGQLGQSDNLNPQGLPVAS